MGAVRERAGQAGRIHVETRGDGAMSSGNAGAASGGAIYGLGIFGAWVWFFQQADTFWQFVLAFFQGLFWPAFMIYDIFRVLAR
jgi:hypothetical protein